MNGETMTATMMMDDSSSPEALPKIMADALESSSPEEALRRLSEASLLKAETLSEDL